MSRRTDVLFMSQTAFHDSIAVFEVNQYSGELTFVERVSTEGNWYRDFVFDPTEGFLVASNEETGNLVLFERDKETY